MRTTPFTTGSSQSDGNVTEQTFAAAVLTPVSAAEFPLLRDLAGDIWRAHYRSIIPPAQIEYMLRERYGDEPLARVVADADRWLELLRLGGEPVGYCGSELDRGGPDGFKIAQLYLAQSHRGRGLGRFMLRHLETRAESVGRRTLFLQVNKRNGSAIDFYHRAGYSIREAAVFDIGQGFVMDDYVMEKRL